MNQGCFAIRGGERCGQRRGARAPLGKAFRKSTNSERLSERASLWNALKERVFVSDGSWNKRIFGPECLPIWRVLGSNSSPKERIVGPEGFPKEGDLGWDGSPKEGVFGGAAGGLGLGRPRDGPRIPPVLSESPEPSLRQARVVTGTGSPLTAMPGSRPS